MSKNKKNLKDSLIDTDNIRVFSQKPGKYAAEDKYRWEKNGPLEQLTRKER